MTVDDQTPELCGREHERGVLDGITTDVVGGTSRCLLLLGDAGVGKTALLNDHALRWPGSVVRLAGVHSETSLPFAAVHRLVSQLTSTTDRLVPRQRDALRVALGEASGPVPDRFLVGLAVHGLLVAESRIAPLLVCVDDLQWIDAESADVVSFVSRRLRGVRVALVLGSRDLPGREAFAGIDTLTIGGLDPVGALSLLAQVVDADVDPHVVERIITATGGNALAIVDLSRELSEPEMAGGSMLPDPLPIGSHLEAHYLRQVLALPEETRTWLLVAAAENTGDVATVTAAAQVLGSGAESASPAEAAGLVRVTTRVAFRHPLVASSTYNGAPSSDRRRAHAAIASVLGERGNDLWRAWHLGAAVLGVDEYVARELEASAALAQDRGGYAARADFLQRSAELTPLGPARTARVLAAAEAALLAGSARRAGAALRRLDTGLLEGVDLGRALMVQAGVQAASPDRELVVRGPTLFLRAADAFAADAPDREVEAVLRAFEALIVLGRRAVGVDVETVAARALRCALVEEGRDQSLSTVLLVAMAQLASAPAAEAMPHLRAASAALTAPFLADDDLVRHAVIGLAISTALWDEPTRNRQLVRTAERARDTGSLSVLHGVLWMLALSEATIGRLVSAQRHLDQALEVGALIRPVAARDEVFRCIELIGWTGTSASLAEDVERSIAAARQLGLGAAEAVGHSAQMIIHIARSEYEQAYERSQLVLSVAHLHARARVLPDVVETAAMTMRHDEAAAALERLAEAAEAADTPWVRGLLARSRAVTAGDGAEPHFVEAIAELSTTRAVGDLARAHLLLGEWLRRRRRRRDARDHLHAAERLFAEQGAGLFAQRARRELKASSGRAGSHDVLTEQEVAVAQLAAAGATNAEIATRLLVSRHTVDFHLRKVYARLGVNDRRDLGEALGRAGA